ncbi:MAG: 16S rRNA (cytidine(1402)-2'-O)-methyltransferase [Thermodesulfobacteriota bacterium]
MCAATDQHGAPGTLYVVATPIGNLEDITLRALRILKEVAVIASEDTRHTRKLLTHFGIHTPLVSYFKGQEASKAQGIIVTLSEGRDVALVSDAGTPAIADPGTILVQKAREAGIAVVPVPGPSALAAALSVAGFDGPVLFAGFLPAKSSQRRTLLESLAHQGHHLLFYEAPHRIVQSLADCLAVLGDRRLFLGRELTKLHEESLVGQLAEVLADLASRPAVKGEFVVLVEGGGESPLPGEEAVGERLRWHRAQGASLKSAVQAVMAELGLPRSAVYKQALALWHGDGPAA